MSPENGPRAVRYALLSSGANFSCEVMQGLIDRDFRPDLVVLPEYPPAARSAEPDLEIVAATPRRRLLALAGKIDIAYAPAARQRQCARLIRQSAIEFLLVACWPYLIDAAIIESAEKAALNLHPSLLPRFRGPDPVAQQLAAGEANFGVTLHQLNQRFDGGDIIAQAALRSPGLRPRRDIVEGHCARLGVELFIDAIGRYPDWKPISQSYQSGATD
ncbi:MAG: formyltransferase family protein [Gammaproteobacteria bacterium]|nr:formyltransferase family protein [Gammaproteobacteria bacterium]MDH3534780.1 formyltransferase family protein [Gammaproteobacteria bacterium]